MKAQIAASKRNYFRDWIAFDAEFSTALLEVEINANSLLNSDRQHSNADVSLDKINHYLIKAGASLPVTPAEEARIYRFTTSRIFVEAGGGRQFTRLSRQAATVDAGSLRRLIAMIWMD